MDTGSASMMLQPKESGEPTMAIFKLFFLGNQVSRFYNSFSNNPFWFNLKLYSDLWLDQPSSDDDNHDFAHTYADGKWGDGGDSGDTKFYAICSYIVEGTAP